MSRSETVLQQQQSMWMIALGSERAFLPVVPARLLHRVHIIHDLPEVQSPMPAAGDRMPRTVQDLGLWP